jgi:hypothetical protein
MEYDGVSIVRLRTKSHGVYMEYGELHLLS